MVLRPWRSGLLPDQFDGQLALGPEWLGVARGRGQPGQLTLAEVEPPGDRQIPGGSPVVPEQGPEADPVVGPHGGGPVGAAGGVLVEGAGAPDIRAVAMDLGVIGGPDVVAVPDPPRCLLDQPGQAAGDVVGPPGAGLGEGLDRLPVARAFDGQDGLG